MDEIRTWFDLYQYLYSVDVTNTDEGNKFLNQPISIRDANGEYQTAQLLEHAINGSDDEFILEDGELFLQVD